MTKPEFQAKPSESPDYIPAHVSRILSALLRAMGKAAYGGDCLEVNLFWPDLGVIHLKMKSDGLLNFLRYGGSLVFLKTADTALYRHNEECDDGENSFSPVDQVKQEMDGDDYL